MNKGHRMLQAGILNTLLTRMDLPCATELSCAAPLDIPLKGEEYPRDIMLLKMKLLWSLMRSVLSSKTLPEHLKDLPSLKQCAMWYHLIARFNHLAIKHLRTMRWKNNHRINFYLVLSYRHIILSLSLFFFNS